MENQVGPLVERRSRLTGRVIKQFRKHAPSSLTPDERKRRQRQAISKWRQGHPEQVRAYGRRARLKSYGLDEDSLDALKASQDYSCAICFDRRKLYLDRKWGKGKHRGLLCTRCRYLMAILQKHFPESYDVAESLANYIKQWQLSERS